MLACSCEQTAAAACAAVGVGMKGTDLLFCDWTRVRLTGRSPVGAENTGNRLILVPGRSIGASLSKMADENNKEDKNAFWVKYPGKTSQPYWDSFEQSRLSLSGVSSFFLKCLNISSTDKHRRAASNQPFGNRILECDRAGTRGRREEREQHLCSPSVLASSTRTDLRRGAVGFHSLAVMSSPRQQIDVPCSDATCTYLEVVSPEQEGCSRSLHSVREANFQGENRSRSNICPLHK